MFLNILLADVKNEQKVKPIKL